jgi:hypothetical protein
VRHNSGFSDQHHAGLHKSFVGEQYFGYRADPLAFGCLPRQAMDSRWPRRHDNPVQDSA